MVRVKPSTGRVVERLRRNGFGVRWSGMQSYCTKIHDSLCAVRSHDGISELQSTDWTLSVVQVCTIFGRSHNGRGAINPLGPQADAERYHVRERFSSSTSIRQDYLLDVGERYLKYLVLRTKNSFTRLKQILQPFEILVLYDEQDSAPHSRSPARHRRPSQRERRRPDIHN